MRLGLMMNKQEQRWKKKKKNEAARKHSEVSILKEIQTLTTTIPV